MKYLLLMPFILFLHASCKKSRTIEVSAINPVTGEPYPGQTFSIRSCRSGAFEDNCKTVYEGVTNENGVALVETRLNTNRRHTLFLAAPDDYCYRSIPSYNIDEELDHQEVTFEFAPCAFLKLKIENVNCQNQNDMIQFRRLFLGEPDVNWSTEREGCYSFESPDHFRVPMGWVSNEWKGVKNGQSFFYKDSIYLDEGAYGEFEMFY